MLEITTTTKRLLPANRLGAFLLGLPIKYPFITDDHIKELGGFGATSINHHDGATTQIVILPQDGEDLMWITGAGNA